MSRFVRTSVWCLVLVVWSVLARPAQASAIDADPLVRVAKKGEDFIRQHLRHPFLVFDPAVRGDAKKNGAEPTKVDASAAAIVPPPSRLASSMHRHRDASKEMLCDVTPHEASLWPLTPTCLFAYDEPGVSASFSCHAITAEQLPSTSSVARAETAAHDAAVAVWQETFVTCASSQFSGMTVNLGRLHHGLPAAQQQQFQCPFHGYFRVNTIAAASLKVRSAAAASIVGEKKDTIARLPMGTVPSAHHHGLMAKPEHPVDAAAAAARVEYCGVRSLTAEVTTHPGVITHVPSNHQLVRLGLIPMTAGQKTIELGCVMATTPYIAAVKLFVGCSSSVDGEHDVTMLGELESHYHAGPAPLQFHCPIAAEERFVHLYALNLGNADVPVTAGATLADGAQLRA